MNRKFSRDDIEEFVEKYSFEQAQIEKYKKLKRLEQLTDALGFSLGAFAFYGTIIFGLLWINSTLYQYLNIGFENSALEIFPNSWILLSLSTGWFMMFILLKLSIQFSTKASETGINKESYTKHKLSRSYCCFKSKDYGEALNWLSDFYSSKSLIFESLFPKMFVESFQVGESILSSLDMNPIPENKRQYIKEYVNKAQESEKVDEDFIEDTFEDVFSLLLEEALISVDENEIMLEIITTSPDERYLSKPKGSKETLEAPSYPRLIKNVMFRILPEVRAIWAFYLIILIVGLILAKTSGVMAVVVVSVLLSALQIYKDDAEG